MDDYHSQWREGVMTVDVCTEHGTRRMIRAIDHWECPHDVVRGIDGREFRQPKFMLPYPRISDGELVLWHVGSYIPQIVRWYDE